MCGQVQAPQAGALTAGVQNSRRRSRWGSHTRPLRRSVRASASMRSVRWQDDDGDPDLILREVTQRRVSQAGLLHVPDPAFEPGSPSVPQFHVGELSALGTRHERGSWLPSESVSRNCAPGCRCSARAMTRIPSGQTDVEQSSQFGDPRPVPWMPVGVVCRRPRRCRDSVPSASIAGNGATPRRMPAR